MKGYAGIGSRETPSEVCALFEEIAIFLANKGYTLRSGHAKGADQAFENGCDEVHGSKEIYIPWKGFENSDSDLYHQAKKAIELARQFHPYWNSLKDGAKKLQARNSYQILGENLKSFSNFVVCWTKNGLGEGGTGQAIRLARNFSIPVFDAGLYENVENIKSEFNAFYKANKIL